MKNKLLNQIIYINAVKLSVGEDTNTGDQQVAGVPTRHLHYS